MGGYGYRYESYSTYDTAGGGRIEEPFASLVKKPFGPYVPNSSKESYVPRRKQVPVTTGSYGDEYRHSSPTKAYPGRDDAYEWHRRTNPVHGRPDYFTNVQNEASRPAGFNPAATDWRQRPNGTANGYGDYGSSKEGHNRKPIDRSDSDDDYDRDDGYGGNYGHKGHRPIVRPIGNDIYDDNHDNSYGEEHSMGPRVFKSPDGHDNFKSPVRNDSYDGYPPAGNGEPKKPAAGLGWNRPIWTAPPKQGTQLTSPTSDINMAVEMLKNLSAGPKATANDYPNDKYDNFRARNDGLDRPTKEAERIKPRTTVAPPNAGYKQYEPVIDVVKAKETPAKEPERIKNVVTAVPRSRTTVPVEPRAPNKYDRDGLGRYVDSGTIDSKRAEREYNGRLL